MKLLDEVNFISDKQIDIASRFSEVELKYSLDEYFEYLFSCAGVSSDSEKKVFMQGFYACADIMAKHLENKRLLRRIGK